MRAREQRERGGGEKSRWVFRSGARSVLSALVARFFFVVGVFLRGGVVVAVVVVGGG
jgi:hypothetical protein